jgi:hypothetical protein
MVSARGVKKTPMVRVSPKWRDTSSPPLHPRSLTQRARMQEAHHTRN